MDCAYHPLRAYREAKGLTLHQLGVLLGVNKSTILRWEAGAVPADRVVEVERVTGVLRQRLRPDIFGGVPTGAAAE